MLCGVALVLLAHRHDAEPAIVHGRDHGRRRGDRQRDPAGHFRRARPRRRAERDCDGALEGPADRVRPILMTSCAMIAGMMPMALGLGEGGDQTAPLGRAVIGGLAAGTLVTLLILPAAFALLMGGAGTFSTSLDPFDPSSPRHVPNIDLVREEVSRVP